MKSMFPALTIVALLAGGSAAAAQSPAPFTYSLPLRDGTATLTVNFHTEKGTMVACTPEQVAWIGKRSQEHLTEMVPALEARMFSRHDKPGTVLNIDLDAACYDNGFMGLGGFARGTEAIVLGYEESKLGGDWGPFKQDKVQTQ